MQRLGTRYKDESSPKKNVYTQRAVIHETMQKDNVEGVPFGNTCISKMKTLMCSYANWPKKGNYENLMKCCREFDLEAKLPTIKSEP